MKEYDIERIIASLSLRKPVFHSEDDLQSAFADEVKNIYPQAKVKREIPYNSVSGYSEDEETPIYSKGSTRIDVQVSLENNVFLIELKYKTKFLSVEVDNEKYTLKEHGAHNDNRVLFVRDVSRLEDYMINEYNQTKITEAYAIFITNDPEYQRVKKDSSVIKDYDISIGEMKTGVLRNRNKPEQTVFLAGEYVSNWSEYSRVSAERNGVFWINIYRVYRENLK